MQSARRDLTHDLLLPCLLFAALGAMTWAVRGSAGYGGWLGCTFAGVTWGTAWWFIARDPSGHQSRPYASGWVILALTLGIGFSGDRGWMQWSHFFTNRMYTNYALGHFEPISKGYGFLWLFIAGVPWAGLGACLLAWCSDRRKLRVSDWILRLGCGIGAGVAARWLFDPMPGIFLPLHETLAAQYANLQANPTLGRLVNDNREAITHLGLYLGFLAYETFRRDWRNVKLILTVGLLNGVGWAACQNWKWAVDVWPNGNFNWWRCWESCGGISIGLAYGVAFYWVNRRRDEGELVKEPPASRNPNCERLGAYIGLILGLGVSIRSGFKGWANIHYGDGERWSHELWLIFGSLMALGLMVLFIFHARNRLPKDFQGDVFPNAHRIIWLVLITQNILAQMVTAPFTNYTQYTRMFFTKKHPVTQTGSIEAWLWRRWQS